MNSGRSYLFTAVQLQTIQILTNDVQMVILCLSYFITTVFQFSLLGLPDDVTSMVHLCCGYPTYCDQDDYKKADKDFYKTLAPLLDNSGIKQFSIEDAEAQNNLEELLPLFKKSSIIFGAITIARSKIEEFDELKARIVEALKFIDPERLILAPIVDLIFAKLEVLARIAKEF